MVREGYDGPFEREQERERKVAKDEKEQELLTERVVMDLVLFLAKKKETEKKEEKIMPIWFSVPKRKRTGYEVEVLHRNNRNREEDGNRLKKKNGAKRCFPHLDFDYGEEILEKKRKKAKKAGKVIKKKMVHGKLPVEAIELPDRFREGISNMGGTDIQLVVVKPLYKTDLSKRHNRLSVPINQVLHKFLKPEEELLLEQDSSAGGSCRGIDILFIEPSQEVCHEMRLKRWDMENTFSYMLSKGWNSVVERNKEVLQVEATVQLWSFRIDKQLGLQLIVEDNSCEVSDERSCVIDQDVGASTTTTVEEHRNQLGFQLLVQDNSCRDEDGRAISTGTTGEDGSTSHGSSCLIQPAEPVPSSKFLNSQCISKIWKNSDTLPKGWISVVERNKKKFCKRGAVVQLFSFKIRNRPWFQLIVPDNTSEVTDKSSEKDDGERRSTTTDVENGSSSNVSSN